MKKNKKRKSHKLRNVLIILVVLIISAVLSFNYLVKVSPPDIIDMSALDLERENPATDFYRIGNNWLRKNQYGLWEMYLEGNPFEIGVINGKLTAELIQKQEDAFVEQINTLIPSKSYLRFLKYFLLWFNRDIDKNIPEEYLQEIYGVSFSASGDYDYIGNNYERMLNYHAAHDIGHALQSLALVGCTSFADNLQLNDSSLIIGRNFDFYINPAFAENKIIAMVNPEKGYKFVYVTWASMIGVVSGMNEEGLTVTINAAKSDIPTKAATPISILAREILQYAGTIDEAIAIAEKRSTFVSESLLIGSAYDNNAVIIEKSPSKIEVYHTINKSLVCSNHFQSKAFADDENNKLYMKESASVYRQKRCEQLIDSLQPLNYQKAAQVLRNHLGINDRNIGIGNEKTMAQMISHHSVIFEPLKKNMWVSTSDYQLGEYLMYNLPRDFELCPDINENTILYDSAFTIIPDEFIYSNDYQSFRKFRELIKLVKEMEEKRDNNISNEIFEEIIALNPEYYYGYVFAGDYFYENDNVKIALDYYRKSLSKEFENTVVLESVKDKIKKLEKRQ